MDIAGGISIKRFTLLFVVASFLFLMVLVITPPYSKDPHISYYNPETQKTDYHLKWNNWFWLGFFVYVLMVAYVGSLIAFTHRRDITHMWHAIPDYFRQKFLIPHINNMDFSETIMKEVGENIEIITTINNGTNLNKMIYMLLKTNAVEGENPVKKICTNDWALNEIRNYMRESTSVTALIDKLGSDKSGILTEVVKKKIGDAEQNEEIS